MLPDPLDAVLFDMDGLLVNTEAIYRDAILGEAEARGRPMPLDLFLQMIGLPAQASDQLTSGHFGDGFDVDAFNAGVTQRVHARLAVDVVLKTGVVELLNLLDERSIRRAIVTSSSHATVAAHLGRSGILPRFEAVIARGDYVRGKPSADPYLRAVAVLGIDPSDVSRLRDSFNGVRAAHAAGVATIMVPDLLTPTDEMLGLCIAVVPTLHDVGASLLEAQARVRPSYAMAEPGYCRRNSRSIGQRACQPSRTSLCSPGL